MALLSDAIRAKSLDIRMIPRSIRRGLLQQDEVEKQLKALPDDSENADYINVQTMFESIGGRSGLR